MMTTSDIKTRLNDVLGFPVTPFHKDLSVDWQALDENLEEMASHPFCTLVAAGGSGEMYSLTPEEIVDVVRVTVRSMGGRMPVIAGAGFNTVMAVSLSQRLEKIGADALLVILHERPAGESP